MCPCEKIILFLVAEAGEYTPGGFLTSAFADRSFGPTNEDLLWKLQYRIVEEYGERTETPEQRLKDKDKRRSTYYRFYTGQKWGQVQAYDMTLNSGKLGIEKCAELICTILA